MTIEDDERREKPLVMEGKRYLNATMAADYLGITRATFYRRGIPKRLFDQGKQYEFGDGTRKYYAETDLNLYK